jgi:hypothetical protein
MSNHKSNIVPQIQPEAVSDVGELLSLEKGRNEISRISNTLSMALAARKQPSLFDELEANERIALQSSDKKYYINRKGKAISLSVEQIKLIKYISSCIPFANENVKENIAIINTMNAKGEMNSDKPLSPVQIPISIVNACKDIIGTAKEKDIKTMSKRLIALSQMQQVQPFKVGTKEYKVVRPLILLNEQIYEKYSEIRSTKGRKKEEAPKEEEDILIAANVIVSSLLLYEAQNKYCPFFKEKYFLVSKKNKTELFHILLSDLESKWRQYYINYTRAESQYKKNNKELLSTNKEEYYKGLGLARKNALTYKCSLVTLRDRVTTDYESQRVYRAKYLKDIQKALASCIEYGIITDKSHVSTDKQNLILVYNQNFNDTKIEEVEAEEV